MNEILPKIKSSSSQTMIYIPSYFDYILLRNALANDLVDFCVLSDYTTAMDISRARSWFYHKEKQILLVTERFHFYHRYFIKGIHNIVFYQLPFFPDYYSEFCNMVSNSEFATSIVLYSVFDKLLLQNVLGQKRASILLKSLKATHLFVSK
eukprot:TRINITY_DN6253_c0_g1_i2.p1 TRINITY_DN6253_c0_g1~~TRINITY_DN6253_c0_g1_i2.p1  ORF type:complete len:151 (-),score=27.90 TRINITY_DN6253_c0_g1_i2:94-546(-)